MNDCCKRGVCLWTAVLLLNGLAGPARADGERLVLRDFRAAGADFAFLQWHEALQRVPAGLEVGGPETKGQGGFGASAQLNATGFADAVP